MTLQALLEQLINERRIPADTIDAVGKSDVMTVRSDQSPWYVQTLVGFSAWIAAILFLVFIFGMDVIDSEGAAVVLGIIFMVATALTRRKMDSVFVNQLMLAFHLVGQAMFLVGMSDSEELAAALTIGLEIIVIMFYRDVVLRFLATLFAYAAIVGLGYMYDIPNALHGLIVLSAFAVGALWYHDAKFSANRFAAVYTPVRYAMTFALLLLLIPSMLADISVSSWWISTAGLLAVLLIIEHRLFAHYAIAPFGKTGVMIMGGTALFHLPLLMTPGITAAVLVLVLGFQRGQRVLMGLALVFLAVFLIAFYYHLDVTLLVKSGILAASGIVLLGMRWALLRQLDSAAHDAHAHS